jgi:hypothetical protein
MNTGRKFPKNISSHLSSNVLKTTIKPNSQGYKMDKTRGLGIKTPPTNYMNFGKLK